MISGTNTKVKKVINGELHIRVRRNIKNETKLEIWANEKV